MNNKTKIFFFIFIGIILLSIQTSCKKDTSKIKVKINWNNPDDIQFGTTLTDAQLNATAEGPGRLVYTPDFGTRIGIGKNQDLRVDFISSDEEYENATKTVKINVLGTGTVTDIDGNVYETIEIGTQVWMAENLRTTKYRDGSAIPYVTDATAWKNLTTGAFCKYNNDVNKDSDVYGYLYNWYSVNDSRNIAPAGWHVPTSDDYSKLVDYLGYSTMGNDMKEMGITHWLTPNSNATNITGFTALPGGFRDDNGKFWALRLNAFFWTSTESDYVNSAWDFDFSYNSEEPNVYHYNKKHGLSIRCVKD